VIRTALSLLLYGIAMFLLGAWAATHPTRFSDWLNDQWQGIGHRVNKECETATGWYRCDSLVTPSPTL
jgi:hypothetical protein